MPRALASGLILASAFVLSACSGGDEEKPPDRENGQAATITSSAGEAEPRREWELAIEPGPQRRAESILLAPTDLPGSWEPKDRGVGVVVACVGGDYSSLVLTGTARSEVFQRPEVGRLMSVASVFGEEQMAADSFAMFAEEFGHSTVEQCVVELLSEHPDAPEIEVTIREIPLRPRLAVEDAEAWLAAITYSDPPYTAYEQTVVMRDNETIAFVMTWAPLRPFNPVLEDRLLATVASRIADSS